MTRLPIDKPGGQEDLQATERLADRLGGLARGAKPLPAESIRHLGFDRDRRLVAGAAVATALHAAIDQLLLADGLVTDIGERKALLSPIGEVARRFLPTDNRADGPPSTWPIRMKSFYLTAVAALAEIRTTGPGNESTPLSELWELYQSWVLHQVYLRSVDLFGTPVSSFQGSMVASWRWNGETLELHQAPRIPASSSSRLALGGKELWATIGDLEPDILLIRRAGNNTNLLIVDPKKRSYLKPADLSKEASKYLWGIRGADELAAVILVAPAGGAASATSEGKAWTEPMIPVDAELSVNRAHEWWKLIGVG